MARKRQRELEAKAGVEDSSAGAGSAEIDTLAHAGKRPKKSSKAASKQTPRGKGKAQLCPGNATDSNEDGDCLLSLESEIIIVSDDPLEDTAARLSLKPPLAELRLRAQHSSMESPLPQNTWRGL